MQVKVWMSRILSLSLIQKYYFSDSPGDSHRQIPIIAMTANVFQEDIEKCLEAGMNGHKPQNLDNILRQLRLYLVFCKKQMTK
jgi:CheY-like chemotaxis protein